MKVKKRSDQASANVQITTITLGLPSTHVHFLRIEADRLDTRPSAVAQALIGNAMVEREENSAVPYGTDADAEEPHRRPSSRAPPVRAMLSRSIR